MFSLDNVDQLGNQIEADLYWLVNDGKVTSLIGTDKEGAISQQGIKESSTYKKGTIIKTRIKIDVPDLEQASQYEIVENEPYDEFIQMCVNQAYKTKADFEKKMIKDKAKKSKRSKVAKV